MSAPADWDKVKREDAVRKPLARAGNPTKAFVPVSYRRPTVKQLRYLKGLCERVGMEYHKPSNRAVASRTIDILIRRIEEGRT